MKLCRNICILALTLILAMGTLTAHAETYELPYFLNQFEGTGLNIQEFWGKAFLIVFFTESSPACIQQFPDIKMVYDYYSPDELQIIMIHEWANETEENTERVKEEYGLHELYFYEDTDMSIAKKTRIPDIPTLLFMDSAGYLHDAYVYPVPFESNDPSQPSMREVLDSIGISKRIDAPAETPAAN